MHIQPRRYTCTVEHPAACTCTYCMASYAAHWQERRDIDELAARDPEAETARAEFAAWASQAPPTVCPEEVP